MAQNPFADYFDEANDLRTSLGLAARSFPGTVSNMAGTFGATSSPNAPSTTFSPASVGGNIGGYYQNVLQQLPTYAPIQRNISGQIPPDVRNMLAQAAAERGVGIGSYGGGADQSALLRSLGLTSLDLTNKGIDQYGEAFRSVPALSPGELFITPTAQAGMNLQQQLQANQLASEASLQSARLRSAEQMQANQLSQDAYQFGINRADTWSGVQATNAQLQGIMGRVGGGATSSLGWNEGVYGGAGTGGTYGTAGYTPPSTYQWGQDYGPPISMTTDIGTGYNADYDIYQSDAGDYSFW